MSFASFLQRVFGAEPDRKGIAVGFVAPKSGPLGIWVRKRPFRVALGWGLLLVLLGFLPLDGFTRPSSGRDILMVAHEDRARVAPELQTCLGTTGELREACPALEQTDGGVP